MKKISAIAFAVLGAITLSANISAAPAYEMAPDKQAIIKSLDAFNNSQSGKGRKHMQLGVTSIPDGVPNDANGYESPEGVRLLQRFINDQSTARVAAELPYPDPCAKWTVVSARQTNSGTLMTMQLKCEKPAA